MKKVLPILLLTGLYGAKSFATADDVYHERTTNTIGGGCGTFVNTLSPNQFNSVVIGFRIANQGFTNRAKIYYTIDGTNPSGTKGTPSGTTMVISATYTCTFSDVNGNYDVVFGAIPAYPDGTVVNYITSAYSNFGLEIFGNGGSATSSAGATIFTYTVTASALPLNLVSFSGKKIKENVQLSWITAQEINVDRFEVYFSLTGNQFKNIGNVAAIGNTSISTEYLFTDINATTGNKFYKLKVIDKNGAIHFSNVIKINFNDKAAILIRMMGNDLYIQLPSAVKGSYNVQLINNLGQALKMWTLQDDGLSQNHIINLPNNLSKNIYHVAVKSSAGIFSTSAFIR